MLSVTGSISARHQHNLRSRRTKSSRRINFDATNDKDGVELKRDPFVGICNGTNSIYMLIIQRINFFIYLS